MRETITKDTIIAALAVKSRQELADLYILTVRDLLEKAEVAKQDNVLVLPRLDKDGNIIWALRTYKGTYIEQTGHYSHELYKTRLERLNNSLREKEDKYYSYEDQIDYLHEKRTALVSEIDKKEQRLEELKLELNGLKLEKPKKDNKEQQGITVEMDFSENKEPVTVREIEMKVVKDLDGGIKKEHARVKKILNKFGKKYMGKPEEEIIKNILKEFEE